MIYMERNKTFPFLSNNSLIVVVVVLHHDERIYKDYTNTDEQEDIR